MTQNPFEFAPPPKQLSGLLAVPVDITGVDAVVVLDTSRKEATAEATMRFTLGEPAGNPMFDLRQAIGQAWLDGEPVDPSLLAHHDLGGGADSEMRVLAAPLAAGSSHELRFWYRLAKPLSPEAIPIEWSPDGQRLFWDFFMSDLWPARYLESWFPANFVYDQFPLRLEIRIDGSGAEHTPTTNAAVSPLGVNHWILQFPDRFTALSPMLVLAPSEMLETAQQRVQLSDARFIDVEAAKLWLTPLDVQEQLHRTCELLAHYDSAVAPYIHGTRFTAYLWSGSRSMEYDGAVCSSPDALEHEVFHSWFARGVKPASQCDGWIDEAFTMWSTERERFAAIPFDWTRPPLALSPASPYNRITPRESYRDGFRFFAGIAAEIGAEALREFMFDLYRRDPLQFLTTRALEQYLIERSGRAGLNRCFRRFVYGLE